MFSTISNLIDSRFNVDQRVLDYFAAHLIRHYPRLKLLNASVPTVKRLEECVISADCQLADIMIWSMKLNEVEHVEERSGNNLRNGSDLNQHKKSSDYKFQAAIISGLIEMNKRWEDRISAVDPN